MPAFLLEIAQCVIIGVSSALFFITALMAAIMAVECAWCNY